MAVKDDFRSLSGPSKAAIMLLALGQFVDGLHQ